jgi:O-antigen ligase
MRSISTNRFQQQLWIWVGASLGLNGFFTLLQFYGLFDWMRSSTGRVIHGRINPAGFIGEVNSGGFLFGLAIVFLVYYVATRQPTSLRIFAGILIGLNLIGLAFARGLTASVALIVCLLLWMVFHHWWVFREGEGFSRQLTIFWLVLILAAICGLGIAYKSGVLQRVGRVLKATERGSWAYATAGRTPVYWLTWKMIQEDPLLGRGLNTFGKDFFHFRAETEAGQSVRLLQQSGAFREAHNEYLQIWEELGLLGLMLFLSLMFWPIAVTIQRMRGEIKGEEAYWLGILTLGLVFVSIACLAFFPLRLSVTAAYVALLLAGIRTAQSPHSEGTEQKSGLIRPVTIGILLILAVGLAIEAINTWRANNEAGIAAFLLRSAGTQNYRPAQKRAIAGEALARLEKAQKLAPELRELHNLKGSVLMMLGRYDQAAESYSKGAFFAPSPELYTNLAAAYMALEKRDRAKECLDLALGYAPRYRKARQALKFLENGQ